MADNNLLDTQKPIKTISEFLEAINAKYELKLPTDFSGDSPVAKLMQMPIKVELGDGNSILYEARGDPFNFEKPNLTAWVIITVKTSTTV
ncbi:hypothetical protein [Microcoleus sp. Pol12B5]|uniref:hypothetical protein n=1 Tax=Microcoleus sp. Pol12B5 TaxID=3055396 RepID=UPI002FD48E59